MDRYTLRTTGRTLLDRYEQRIPTMPRGTRTAARAKHKLYLDRWITYTTTSRAVPPAYTDRNTRIGIGLARLAGIESDEHGAAYTRGDHWGMSVLDAVDSRHSAAAPYLDSGHAGLAVIQVNRHRVYAKSSHWRPSDAASLFLVGRNEAGTYFAHALPNTFTKTYSRPGVGAALAWMWSGHSRDIILRQGDIAIVRAHGQQYPARLPSGHRIDGDQIVHPTHPAIRLPGKGERVIIARRATPRVSSETRD